MKKNGIMCIFLLFCTLLIYAEGYPLFQSAKKTVTEIRTYNWTGAKGWFEGETKKIIVETYDAKGHLVSSELNHQGMTLIEKTTYSYEGDNPVKTTTVNHENKTIRTSIIEKKGDIVTESFYRADGSVFMKNVSIIGSNGKAEELYYYNGLDELVFYKVFRYSDKGDVTTISLYNPDGTYASVVDITYETFDAKGNWLTRSEYYSLSDVWSRPRDSVHRAIEY